MPSFVSKDHKELIERCRVLFRDYEVIGWPDAEINLGRLAGLSEANLRADIFIRFSEREAVAIEWQSSIHALEESSEWFNKDDIAGRDDLKRQICAKIGVGLIEMWTLDMSDAVLLGKIDKARAASHLSDGAVRVLDSNAKAFGQQGTFEKMTPNIIVEFPFGDPKTKPFGVDSVDKFKSASFGPKQPFWEAPIGDNEEIVGPKGCFGKPAGFKKGSGFGKGTF